MPGGVKPQIAWAALIRPRTHSDCVVTGSGTASSRSGVATAAPGATAPGPAVAVAAAASVELPSPLHAAASAITMVASPGPRAFAHLWDIPPRLYERDRPGVSGT